MSDIDKAWDSVSKVAYGETKKEVNDSYTEWAKKYDEELDTLGYQTPENLVRELLKHSKNTETTTILDVGAGTGKCGKLLKNVGYKGIMDALEINGAMLEVARSKNIYRNHVEMGVFPDKEIPLEHGLYDGVVCAGSMLHGHMEAECVATLIQVLKPGGVAVWNTRDTEKEKEYREKVARSVEQLVKSGEIEKIDVKAMQHYKTNCRETGDKMMAIVYVYRKL
ncbi:uncharacterized protein LOC120340938 [Styela clava]